MDHAWTYRVEHGRQQLEQIPGLLHRMASLMGVPFHGEAPDPDTVDLVMDSMWKYSQTYQLAQGVCPRGTLHPTHTYAYSIHINGKWTAFL